jgi:adenosylcobinamide-GDP ribazoletransferase
MPPLVYETAAWLRFYTRLPIPALPGEGEAVSAPEPARTARAIPLAGAAIGWIAGMVLVIAWLLGANAFVAAALAVLAVIAVTDGRPERALAAAADSLRPAHDPAPPHPGGLSAISEKLHLHHAHGVPLGGLAGYGGIAVALAVLLRTGALESLTARSAVAAGFALVGAGAAARAAAAGFALMRPADGTATSDEGNGLQWLALFGIGIGFVTVTVLPGYGVGATIAALAAAAGGAALVSAFVPRDEGGAFAGTAALVAEISFLLAIVAFARTP